MWISPKLVSDAALCLDSTSSALSSVPFILASTRMSSFAERAFIFFGRRVLPLGERPYEGRYLRSGGVLGRTRHIAAEEQGAQESQQTVISFCHICSGNNYRKSTKFFTEGQIFSRFFRIFAPRIVFHQLMTSGI